MALYKVDAVVAMTLGGISGHGFNIVTEPGSRPVVTIGGFDGREDADAAAAKFAPPLRMRDG